VKTTNQVIDAVKEGAPVTELEMKCAIVQLAYHANAQRFDIARALVEVKENDNEGKLTKKTIRGLGYIWRRLTEDFDKDLGTFIMGTSMEPGISKEERNKRFGNSVFRTTTKLHEVLTKK